MLLLVNAGLPHGCLSIIWIWSCHQMPVLCFFFLNLGMTSFLLYAKAKYRSSVKHPLLSSHLFLSVAFSVTGISLFQLPTFHRIWWFLNSCHVFSRLVSDWKSLGFHKVMSAWVRAPPRMWCVSVLLLYLIHPYSQSDCGVTRGLTATHSALVIQTCGHSVTFC